MINSKCKNLMCLCFSLVAFFTSVAPSHVLAEQIKLEQRYGFDSVYFVQDPDATVVKVGVTILAGEVDVNGPEGLSHYVEHLVYWNADNVNAQRLHARRGSAWVNGIVTSYFNEGELSELDDMLEFVHRVFIPLELSEKYMLNERSVVAREYDLRVSESPVWRYYDRIRPDLYKGLPVSRSTIGTPESIHSFTPEQASLFHKKFYQPANAVLFIAGDFDKEEVEQKLEQRFGEYVAGRRHDAKWREAQLLETSDTTQEFNDPQANYDQLIYLSLSAWPQANPNRAVENWYTLNLLRAALDSALEGGLARPLRMDNFVLRSFDVDLNTYLSNYFEMSFFAEPDKGVSLRQASKSISDTLVNLSEVGIPSATLERVRERMLQTEKRIFQNTENNYFRSSEQLTSGLSPVTSAQHLSHIKNVSLDDVNNLLTSLAKPVRRSIAFIQPSGE